MSVSNRLRREAERSEEIGGCLSEAASLLHFAADEIDRLQRTLSAAMRIVCDPGLLTWGWDSASDSKGYFVRIGENMEFVGIHLHDAIGRLAEKVD